LKIVPGTLSERPANKLERLTSFRHTLESFSELPDVVEKAGEKPVGEDI
jgi:hypothetical protein